MPYFDTCLDASLMLRLQRDALMMVGMELLL